jgi:hypothetical protein
LSRVPDIHCGNSIVHMCTTQRPRRAVPAFSPTITVPPPPLTRISRSPSGGGCFAMIASEAVPTPEERFTLFPWRGGGMISSKASLSSGVTTAFVPLLQVIGIFLLCCL